MTTEELKTLWQSEEDCAYIRGWDFSHIHGRYAEAEPPWDYEAIIRSVLTDDKMILDYDTGGGEFLLSLRHPYENTAATEGYPPNVARPTWRFAGSGWSRWGSTCVRAATRRISRFRTKSSISSSTATATFFRRRSSAC